MYIKVVHTKDACLCVRLTSLFFSLTKHPNISKAALANKISCAKINSVLTLLQTPRESLQAPVSYFKSVLAATDQNFKRSNSGLLGTQI